MKRLVLIVLLLTACEVPKDAKVSLAPQPIEETQPVVEIEPTPEPTAEPTPQPTVEPTPSPTPQPNACNDPDYPLIGTWQNLDRPEDVMEINSDCTYFSYACSSWPRAWEVTSTNVSGLSGQLLFNTNGGTKTSVNDPYYCSPQNGIHVATRPGGWNLNNNTGPNQISISFHYWLGSQLYVRID